MVFFYLLVAIMPLNVDDVWGVEFRGVSLVKCLGALCVLAAVIHIAAKHSFPPVLQNWVARWFLIYFSIQIASYLVHGGQLALTDTSMFSNLFSILLLFFATLGLIDSVPRLRWVVLVGIGSVAYNSLHAIRQYQVYHNVYADFRSLGGLSGDANLYTLQALLWVPMCFYLIVTPRRRWEKLFCAGSLIVTLAGITLAASRGGFLALAAVSLLVVWRSKQRALNLAFMSLLLVPMIAAHPEVLKRFTKPTYGDQMASQARLEMWQLSLKMFREHPLVGVGMGEYKRTLDRWEETSQIPHHILLNLPHNTYADIGAQLGVLGLIPFLGALFTAYRGLGQAARSARRFGGRFLWPAALGMQAGLVAFAVCAFFLSAWWESMFWLLLFLSIALLEIVRQGAAPARLQCAPTAPMA